MSLRTGPSNLPAVPEEIRAFARQIDAGQARLYSIPMTTRFRGITVREGLLLQGPAGWGEFCPFAGYDDEVSAGWLLTALEAAVPGWPAPVRDQILINATVPAVGPARAHAIVTTSGCSTAKVKVADHPDSLAEDLARLEAVRDALGPSGAVRVDANGVWDVDTAVAQIAAMDAAAGGLQYAEQPCRTIEELAVAEAAGLPCVISSALETSVGLAAQLALAGALPQLDHACGLGTLSLLQGDTVSGTASLVPQSGRLPVLASPPVPDPELLDRYDMRDPERRAWWIDRLRRVLKILIGP